MRHWTLPEALIYGRGNERPFLCPVHGDSRPSASVNMIKKVWYCYTCGARGGLSGENALIEPDYEQMMQWIQEKLEEGRVYPESWLTRWTAGDVHPYWLQRVGADAARHFRLGFDPETESVTYPLRDSGGDVLGVVRRRLDPDGPKYLYPKGVDISRYLFNYSPEHRKVVVLVEGALDAIAFWNVGITAFAVYGSQLSAAQINLVERVDPDFIVTGYDRDDAGFKAHVATERAFRHRMVGRLVWPLSWGKDVDEIGPDHLRDVVRRLALPDLSCVESPTCTSPASTRNDSVGSVTPFSRSTSTPRRLTILRDSA